MDELFGVKSIKVSFSGGSFKEINDCLSIALKTNNTIKYIIRGIDLDYLLNDKDKMRTDLGKFPTYLYDSNVLNDIEYVLNKSSVEKSISMITEFMEGNKPGITSFDQYARWHDYYSFGPETVIPNGLEIISTEQRHLTETERQTITENIIQNITSLADEYPETEFYCFFTPYSAADWCKQKNKGKLLCQIEAEEIAAKLILEHSNIHLFSFNNNTEITTDLNFYKDDCHYGEWVNTFILQCMKAGRYQLSKENYINYLKEEQEFYSSFDYSSLLNQEDYEDDDYAKELLLKIN